MVVFSMDDPNNPPQNPPPKQVVVQLDPEDRALLEQLQTLEKLSKSDIVRRALRRYAKDFGLTTTPVV
jgi:hypothetical protein